MQAAKHWEILAKSVSARISLFAHQGLAPSKFRLVGLVLALSLNLLFFTLMPCQKFHEISSRAVNLKHCVAVG